MATTITDEVLALFRDEIPGYQDDHGKEIPLENWTLICSTIHEMI